MASSRFEQLEQAIQALTTAPDAALRVVTPEIAPLAQIAAELRDLPRASFREGLKAQLQTAINSLPSTAAHSTGDDRTMTTSSSTVTVRRSVVFVSCTMAVFAAACFRILVTSS